MAENISWDDALKNANFVKLETDKEKIISITEWDFEVRDAKASVAAGEVEFVSKCVEEDGEKVDGKSFNQTSKRLIAKLRPILENRDKSDVVKLSILRVGESYQTQYSVKEIKVEVKEGGE